MNLQDHNSARVNAFKRPVFVSLLFSLCFSLLQKSFCCYGQGSLSSGRMRIIDSLTPLLKKETVDTTRLSFLNQLAWECCGIGDFEKAMLHAREAIGLGEILSKQANNKIARAGKKGMASATNTIATLFWNQANYPRALENYLAALKISEEIKNRNGMQRYLSNIANVYSAQADYPKALEYYFMALKLSEELKSKRRTAITLDNIGIAYNEMKNYRLALEYYLKALKMAREIGDEAQEAIILGDIGSVHNDLEQYREAHEYFSAALDLSEKLGDQWSVARHLGNLGDLYSKDFSLPPPEGTRKKGAALAEDFLLRALALSRELGENRQEQEWHLYLSRLYETTGRYKQSFDEYKKYVSLRDSIFNDENTKKTVQQQMQYEFEKKSIADSIRNMEQKRIEVIRHQQEISTQRNYTYAGIAGFLLMIVVAGISYYAFRNKKKANVEIARQKMLVEEKQKEILDSIYYARRIQRALITNERYITKKLNSLNRG